MPQDIAALFQQFVIGKNVAFGALAAVIIIAIILVMVIMVILLNDAERKIPVSYAQKINGRPFTAGQTSVIPLKVNTAGVMPIIFAQAIMFIPIAIVGTEPSGFWIKLMDTDGWVYNVIYAVLIIAFTIFYTAVTVNPQQMADDLKRNNGFIPGVKPGKPTADYIDTVMSRITWPGALFLTIVAVMPAFARLFGVNQAFAQFFGGTSLIILVGVVLDTLQQIESHLLMRHYDGLLSSGRIHGRGMAAY
jgi:preprotein translocase subunit SecY